MTVLDLRKRILAGLASGELLPVPAGSEVADYARVEESCELCEQPIKRGAIALEFQSRRGAVRAHRDCFNLLWQLSAAGPSASI